MELFPNPSFVLPVNIRLYFYCVEPLGSITSYTCTWVHLLFECRV